MKKTLHRANDIRVTGESFEFLPVHKFCLIHRTLYSQRKSDYSSESHKTKVVNTSIVLKGKKEHSHVG
jgi:hypothetical protein